MVNFRSTFNHGKAKYVLNSEKILQNLKDVCHSTTSRPSIIEVNSDEEGLGNGGK